MRKIFIPVVLIVLVLVFVGCTKDKSSEVEQVLSAQKEFNQEFDAERKRFDQEFDRRLNNSF